MNFEIEATKNKVLGSFVWKIIERVCSQGINLIVQIILARILLPSDFASLAIVAAITNYALIFVQTGLSTAIIQKKDIDNLDISTLLISSLFIALVFYVILFIVSPYISDYFHLEDLKWALRVLSLILFLNAISSIQTAILSKRFQFKEQCIRTALAVIISGVVGIYMAYSGFGIWALVVHNLVNACVLIILMLFVKDVNLGLRFSWKRAKKLYAFSLKILGGGLISGFHDSLRTMVIGHKYTPDMLAYYDKAYTYSMYASNIINTSLSSVLLPVFSKKQDNTMLIKEYARRSIRASSFFTFPLLIGIAAMSKPLIIVLLTSKWAASIPFMVVFCLLRIPTSITAIDKQVYYALGNANIGLKYEILLFILNLSSLFITISISPIAIAIGALVVEYIGTMFLFIISSSFYHYSLLERLKDVLAPLISSCVMASAILLISLLSIRLELMLLIQIVIGGIIYIVIQYIIDRNNLLYIVNSVKQGVNKKSYD